MTTMQELEDAILKAWGIVDEIETVRWMMFDREKGATEDEIDNALLGISTLLNAKFEQLFSMYTDALHEQFAKKREDFYQRLNKAPKDEDETND